MPDAFQKFTKFYQFRGGYHSSLGAPMFHLQLKKMFVFNTTFKLFGAETCVTEILKASIIWPIFNTYHMSAPKRFNSFRKWLKNLLLKMKSIFVTKVRKVWHWTAHFCIFIDYKGCHRKGAAICNDTWVNLQPKPWFRTTKKCIFEQYWEVPTIKLTLLWSWKYFSGDLFRASPYRLILVKHKDVLYH